MAKTQYSVHGEDTDEAAGFYLVKKYCFGDELAFTRVDKRFPVRDNMLNFTIYCKKTSFRIFSQKICYVET